VRLSGAIPVSCGNVPPARTWPDLLSSFSRGARSTEALGCDVADRHGYTGVLFADCWLILSSQVRLRSSRVGGRAMVSRVRSWLKPWTLDCFA
jgi:hypothetical protein